MRKTAPCPQGVCRLVRSQTHKHRARRLSATMVHKESPEATKEGLMKSFRREVIHEQCLKVLQSPRPTRQGREFQAEETARPKP